MPDTLTDIDRDVLRIAVQGAVNLEQIHRRLDVRSEAVPLADVADAVKSLVEKGLLEPLSNGQGHSEEAPTDLSLVWRARFLATPLGKQILVDLPDEIPRQRRVYAGMFAGQMPDIPFEVFKENREAMSRKYAPDTFDE